LGSRVAGADGRTGRYSFEDIHRLLFSKRTPKRKTLEQLKEGIRRDARKRHARC
jgi:hypothetical protein